jgi:hypothetical protein
MSTGGVGSAPEGVTGTYSLSGSANTAGLPNTNVYTGPVYCIQASGSFSTTQTFDTIQRLAETVIGKYDVTGAVEVLMDVRLFNNKIGILKDGSNINLTVPTSSFYGDVSNMLYTDSFTIQAQEFIADISNAGATSSIVSVGNLKTIYSDFSNYVATYFGMPNLPSTGATNPNEYGFATLFANDPNFDPNSGVFDCSAFYQLLTKAQGTPGANTWTDNSGGSVTGLQGSLTVSNITALLRNAVDANPFGNRNPSTGTTASDPYDRSNYGVTDGFFADDLFFIPSNGINITLKLNIDQEAFPSPLNNAGTQFMTTTSGTAYSGNYAGIDLSANTDTTFDLSSTSVGSGSQPNNLSGTTSTFLSNTTISSTLISRNVQAPLLIRLMNYSTN